MIAAWLAVSVIVSGLAVLIAGMGLVATVGDRDRDDARMILSCLAVALVSPLWPAALVGFLGVELIRLVRDAELPITPRNRRRANQQKIAELEREVLS